MEALSNSWTPGITGRHLPVHVVPRCYAKFSSNRHNGVFQPVRPSALAIQKNARFSMRDSIFLVEEAPGCEFLPHIKIDRSLATSSAKRQLCRTSTRFPFAMSRYQEDHPARLDNAAQLQPGSDFYQTAPLFCSGPHGFQLNERHSQVKSTPSCQWRNAKELILKSKKLSRLEAKLAGFVDTLGISLEDEKSLLCLKDGIFRRTGKVEHTHNQKETTRRSVLEIRLPQIFERLGFQFSREFFSKRQFKVSASSLDCRTPPTRETNSASMCRMTRETVKFRLGRRMSHSGAVRCGGVLDVKYQFYASSGSTLRASSRVPVPTQNEPSRRLWSRVHCGGETAGNLVTDLLTLVGLVVFVVFGTYAFVMSQQYLKSDLWFKQNPFASKTSFARPAKQTHPKPPNLSQTKIVEITDEGFYDTIQKRPTFVLFYTDWCPFCQKLDPTWIELGNILSKKGYDIQVARMNSEKHPIAAQNLKVVKYPTLIFFKGETTVENYLGPRTVNSLMNFIDEKLHKN